MGTEFGRRHAPAVKPLQGLDLALILSLQDCRMVL